VGSYYDRRMELTPRLTLTLVVLAAACPGSAPTDSHARDGAAESVGWTEARPFDLTPLDRQRPHEGASPDASCSPACQSWEVCNKGGCQCPTSLPAGWPAGLLAPLTTGPLLVPTASNALQGADNVYAPDLHALQGGWVMWYGGQGGDGHDRIFVATSADGAAWRKWPSDSAPQPALDRGSSNHVNDPSVVNVGGAWMMYFTDAAVGEDDRIWLATSTKLTGFSKVQLVLDKGAAGSWESVKVGRPSVLYEGGVFKMWYDGQDGSSRHIGYATSADGKSWTRHAQNPVFKNAGAVDVKRVGGSYVLVTESAVGTYWATSPDGIHCWTDRGLLFGLSGKAYDAHGQVTPFVQVDQGKLRAIWFGGASVATWDKNRIALALPQGASWPGAGCTGCTPGGLSCSAACQAVSNPPEGSCGAPGSTEPSACCSCLASPCAGCLGGSADCHAACVAAGWVGGFCDNPGSTNPSACCACW
jgi:predicted GH43/DUF377 family glycosyl hydrolase